VRVGHPATIVGGGLRFYDRREGIKDMLAYLRLLVEPGRTAVSLLRVPEMCPRRGIGKYHRAAPHRPPPPSWVCPLWEVVQRSRKGRAFLAGRSAKGPVAVQRTDRGIWAADTGRAPPRSWWPKRVDGTERPTWPSLNHARH